MKQIGTYINGNYRVSIYDDGTKIRETLDENATEFIPEFAENVDITITRQCSIGCPFCYDNASKNGKHGNLKMDFLKHLHPYTEVAINGNDLNHPDLLEFLTSLKEQKVIPNITVQVKQFMDNIDLMNSLIEKQLVYGIGVSWSKNIGNYKINDIIGTLKQYKNVVIHTIDGLLTKEDIDLLSGNNLKILILGYKNKGRGETLLMSQTFKDNIKANIDFINDNIESFLNKFKVVSFDNLALEHLPNVRNVVGDKWDEFYMGDDGKYTFYIDLVNETFAKNSCIKESFPIEGNNIDSMFKIIREKY